MSIQKTEELLVALKNATNLCGGGPLISLVYCCGLEKPCPIRNYALKLLGITPEKFKEVKEKHRIDAEGTCFKNLAYCCSLQKECPFRDKVRKRLNMSDEDYLKYKLEILRDLIPREKLDYALKTRVMKPLIFIIVDPSGEEWTEWRGLGFGNPDINAFFIQQVKVKKKIPPPK